jgi:phosphohistidine phosphatase SixA
MIHLVRHADAGQRMATPEDRLRPLSAEGWRQVRALTTWLQPRANGCVLSSPYVRCVATVEWLAAREAHEVSLSDKLAEGGRLEALLGLLGGVPDGSILCTHGDMLKAVISRFEAEEALLQGPACWEKGVVWVLLRVGRRFVRASAIPPLTPKVHALNVVNRVQAAAATSIAAVP